MMRSLSPILLADDDPIFLARLRRALEARDWEVICFGTSAEVRSYNALGSVRSAVVDLRLVDGSGLDLVSYLLTVQPDLPIVVLTGYGSIASALHAVRLGAIDYLTKPATMDQIVAALLGQREPTQIPLETTSETPSLDRVEWEHIQRVLSSCEGNITQASKLLGIDRRSLQRKLAKYPPRR